MSERREQLLDAAIEVLGTGGVRQLTHRAVDTQANLPLGSTSNLFRSRDALLAGVLGRILERETQAWNGLAAALHPLSGDTFAQAVGKLVLDLSGRGRTLTLARHAVFLEAGSRPELRKQIAEGQKRMAAWAVPLISALGSRSPQRDLRLILSFVDGMLGNQLANPQRGFDPAAGIAILLKGLLRPGDVGYPTVTGVDV